MGIKPTKRFDANDDQSRCEATEVENALMQIAQLRGRVAPALRHQDRLALVNAVARALEGG